MINPINDKKRTTHSVYGSRVDRGGGGFSDAGYTRVSYRDGFGSALRYDFLGFRIVRNKR